MATAERVMVTAVTTINSTKVNPDEASLFQRNLGKETGLLRQVGMLFLSKRHIEVFGAPGMIQRGNGSRICFALPVLTFYGLIKNGVLKAAIGFQGYCVHT